MNRIWFVAGSYLLCYNSSNDSYEYERRIEKGKKRFTSICVGKNGEIILTSKNNIYKVDTKTDKVVKLNLPVQDRSIVSSFYHSKKDKYIFMTTKDIVVAKVSDSLSDISIVNTNSFHSRMYFFNSSLLLDDKIYAGYDGGICSFNIYDALLETKNEEVQLLLLKGYNAAFGSPDINLVLYNGEERISFKRPLSDYTFTFQGSTIVNLNKVKYKYKLEGIDIDWSITERNYVDYSNIEPGTYVFRIKSIDNRGLLGKENMLQIRITSPILISKGAKVIYLLLALGVVIVVLLYFRKKLKSEIIVDWNIKGKPKLVLRDQSKEDELFFNEFKSVIEKNISNCDIHVDEMAKVLGVSRTVLYQKVKKISGCSVKAFINLIRLEKAKDMLEDPNININDISFDCGFRSASYFSTAFKKSFEVSPSKYRNAYLKQM